MNPRLDLYTTIHKALRAQACDTLAAIGRMDCRDEADVRESLAALREMITLSRHHLHHENQHVYPAIESRRRGATREAMHEHAEHEAAFERLEAHIERVERSAGQSREKAALDLYRELALHASRDFAHMQQEETGHNAILWAEFSDAELEAIHAAILGSVDPALMGRYLGWFARALTPAEAAGMLAGSRDAMPPEAFQGALDIFRAVLPARDWRKLALALGLEKAA